MADNTVLNVGSGGDVIATDDIGGVKHELVKVEFGSNGTATQVDAANPLPVTDAVSEAALAAIAAQDFATHAAQIDNSQKTQLVDASGNNVTVTGNKLDVNATFSGDIEIGAVEIKNSTTDDRTAVINTAPTTEFGLVTRNIPSGTQPISAASLPLPTGAAIAANQQTNAITDAQIRATPLPVSGTVSTGLTQPLTDAQLRATPVPVSGTVATGGLTDVQLRATPVPISGTVTVTGAGDATAANQATQITAEQAIEAAVQIMDDWDESDRAKVNPIVGQAGVQAGAGAVSANTQRMVIATDQTPIPVTGTFGGTDNTSIYSATLSTTGAITGIDTTGYESIIIYLSGTWNGNLIIEGSGDNSIWSILLVKNVNELSMQDLVAGNGIFQLKATAKFIRINVQQITGSVAALILGRIGTGMNGADMLSFAMDKGNNTPLFIEETATRKDVYKALIPSDAPAPIYGFGNVVNTIIGSIIDTTGYQSISVQLFGTWAGSVQFQESNDGVTWSSVFGQPSLALNTSATSAQTTNGVYLSQLSARFFRVFIFAYTSGTMQMIAFLRQQPVQTKVQLQNLNFISGTAPVAPGIVGGLSVGGFTAAGSISLVNPVVIGGVDGTAIGTAIVRRILTDTSGRLITSVTDSTGTARALGGLAPASNPYNVASLAVQDVATYEGMSIPEMLGEILKQLKLLNYYQSEAPAVYQFNNNRFDEPSVLLNDPTFFIN